MADEFNWRTEEDGDLFLAATDSHPAMVVYYMTSYRGWSWNWYSKYGDTDPPLPPVSERRGIAKRDSAKYAAEEWIRKMNKTED